MPDNKKNIIGFMHYLLFKFLFSKLPFRSPVSKNFFYFFLVFLWGFCMDFLANQTRMNFPRNQMGDEDS